MDKNQKSKNQKTGKYPNPLEALKDIGTSTVSSFKKDFIDKVPEDFMDQLFGPGPRENYSGEIIAGESVEISEVYSGKDAENHKLRQQLAFERRLQEEEKVLVEKKTNELKIQLKALMQEILELSKTANKLAEETEIASMQAPIEPGVYHLVFFEQLLEFIKSFRKQINEASLWLGQTNHRAAKKNAWGANYKKHGGKYLLSGEHYLQRSAG